MKRGLDPRVEYERIQLPEVQTFSGSEYALLVLTDVRTEFRVFIAPVADAAANKARWVAVAGFEDEITDVAIDSGVLWLLANKDHPRGRILKTSVAAPSVATATEVVPEGAVVIQRFERARDGLHLDRMDGGISRLRLLRRDGPVSEIALPFGGTLRALHGSPDEEGALFSFTGWLAPGDIWSVAADGKVAATGLTPPPPIDVRPYEAKRFCATAPRHRRTLRGRHHGRTCHDRAPGAVCGGHRRRRLVESAALRGRAERLRRGAGVGQDLRGGRLPGAEAHRQLPAREGRHRLPDGAADDRRDRSAGRPVPRRENDRAAAGGEQLRQTRPAARGLRRGSRDRLDPGAAGSRGSRHLRVPVVADGREGLPAGLIPHRPAASGGTEDEHGPEAVRGAGAAHGALRRARAGDVSLLGAGARAVRVHAAAGAGDRAAAAPGVARVRPAPCGLAQRQVGARGRRLAAGGAAFAMGAARAPHGRAARAAGGARFLCAARSAGGGPAHAPSPPGAGDRGFQRRRHAAAAPRHLRLVSQLPPDRPAADAVPVGPAVRGGAGARAGASVARTCPPRQLDLPPAPRLDAPGLGAGAAPAVGLGCDPRRAALVRPLLQRLLVPARAPQRVRGGCQLGAAHLHGQRRAGAHERQCDRQLPARAVLAGGRRTGARHGATRLRALRRARRAR